jgi:glycosyltransferase involved in cell wall biosynthesis
VRVVHVYHDVWPVRGGIEDYLATLTRAQAARGINVVILCAHGDPRTQVDIEGGVRIIRAASFGRYYTPLCPTWPAWLGRLRPDLVHVHLPGPLGEWAAWLAQPRRLIVSLHNDYVRPRWALRLHLPMHRAVLQRANAIIVGAPDYGRTSPALAGLQAKVRAVPYGIDAGVYAALCASGSQRERNGVFSAGRLCYYKGIEILLDAAPAVKAGISIAGDGPWRKRLEAQAANAGMDGRVRFMGSLSEEALIRQMHASRVFAFPSTERSESFGLMQLKAMAAGLPIVSSGLPGVSWLNRHGETGLTVPVRDAKALASSLNRVLDDDQLYARLAAGALARARECTVEQMVDATSQLYDEVMSPVHGENLAT